jgi:tRNA(Ile)-lysidine synthase
VPGAVALPGGRLTALLAQAAPQALAAQEGSLFGATQGGIWVDADTVGGHLVVRPRRPGDALQPLGMGGHHKKVQDVLVDARVPREARGGVPIVVRADPADPAREEIVWVVGYCLGEQFKVQEATSRVLRLRWEPAAAQEGFAVDGDDGRAAR